MRNKFFAILIGICVLTLAFSGSVFAKERVIFGGGPAGGTFQVVANGIQVYKPEPKRRIRPALSISLWLIISASAGVSLMVDSGNCDTRMDLSVIHGLIVRHFTELSVTSE